MRGPSRVDGGRARDVRRVRLATQPVRLLNLRPLRGRGGSARKGHDEADPRRLSDRADRREAARDARAARDVHAAARRVSPRRRARGARRRRDARGDSRRVLRRLPVQHVRPPRRHARLGAARRRYYPKAGQFLLKKGYVVCSAASPASPAKVDATSPRADERAARAARAPR